MNVAKFLSRKAAGQEWSNEEITTFVERLCANGISESQIGAFLMAVKINGLCRRETATLTAAKAKFSYRFDWSAKPWRNEVVDKHSTGGIGDKTSHFLAPILAALGVKVPMISGRGLGVTGGTIDKLESIGGYRAQLTPAEVDSLMETVGCCIIGQSKEMVPSDAVLYKNRDITGTVASVPLITASILSKKLCEDIRGLILDVKCGHGMFMQEKSQAEELSRSMLEVGKLLDLSITIMITDMNLPLGNCIGNALEMAEVFQGLNNMGMESRLEQLVIDLASEMLRTVRELAKKDAVEQCRACLQDGRAAKCMARMLQGQGVAETLAQQLCSKPAENVEDTIGYYVGLMGQTAKHKAPLTCKFAGYVRSISAFKTGTVTWSLGAGRKQPGDLIDRSVGIQFHKQPGDYVGVGEVWATLHHAEPEVPESVAKLLEEAIEISADPVERAPILIDVLRP